jgi:hypothetical protein
MVDLKVNTKNKKQWFYSRSFRYQCVYQWTTGSAIQKSLEEYLDVKHVTCANGTDALKLR